MVHQETYQPGLRRPPAPPSVDPPAARAGSPLRTDPVWGRPRGLTLVGCAAVAGVPAVVGAIADAARVGFLGLVFAVLYVAGSLVVALAVRRRLLRAVAFLPPLVYLLGCVAAGLVTMWSDNGSVPARLAVEVATDAVTSAPTLMVATGLTVAVVIVRMRRAGRRRLAERGWPAGTGRH